MATEFLAQGATAVPVAPAVPIGADGPDVSMTADGWVWAALGLLLVLIAVRAWVVESGHARLGRTPVKVTVLTLTCGLVAVVVAGLVTVNGGARLVYLVAHPKEAQALEDAVNAVNATTDPVTPDPAAAADPPDPPSTPTTTPAPAPPPPVTTTRVRPPTRAARPPVRTTSPVAPPPTTAAAPSTSTKASATKTTATRTTAARAAGQQNAASTPPSTARAAR